MWTFNKCVHDLSKILNIYLLLPWYSLVTLVLLLSLGQYSSQVKQSGRTPQLYLVGIRVNIGFTQSQLIATTVAISWDWFSPADREGRVEEIFTPGKICTDNHFLLNELIKNYEIHLICPMNRQMIIRVLLCTIESVFVPKKFHNPGNSKSLSLRIRHIDLKHWQQRAALMSQSPRPNWFLAVRRQLYKYWCSP